MTNKNGWCAGFALELDEEERTEEGEAATCETGEREETGPALAGKRRISGDALMAP